MVHIRRLREKIEKEPSRPEYLINVKGLGYKLVIKMKNNMKWRITGRFLVTVICVVITVVIINIVSLIGLAIYRNANEISSKKYKIEDSVRNFSSNIKEADNKIYIDDKGKAILDSNNGWIQIIDANNNEVYSYKKPSYIKNKPTAAEIVNLHKYKTSDKGSELSTNFVAEKI